MRSSAYPPKQTVVFDANRGVAQPVFRLSSGGRFERGAFARVGGNCEGAAVRTVSQPFACAWRLGRGVCGCLSGREPGSSADAETWQGEGAAGALVCACVCLGGAETAGRSATILGRRVWGWESWRQACAWREADACAMRGRPLACCVRVRGRRARDAWSCGRVWGKPQADTWRTVGRSVCISER